MRHATVLWLAGILLVSIALIESPLRARTAAFAVEPNEFEVVIPKTTLETPVNQPERPTVKNLGQATGRLTARVGGLTCLTVDLADPTTRNPSGDIVIRVGAPGQPPACSVEGAAVTFATGAGQELVQHFVLHRGASVTLSNLAPKPPGSPSSSTQATQGLRYKMHVFSGFRGPTDGPAPDGTLVMVYQLPDRRVQRPLPTGPCASAAVQRAVAEVTVTFTDDCRIDERVGIVLFFPGQLPVTASSEPPLEWRQARPAEVALVDVVVRPIPPNTAGEGIAASSAAITPPVTGSGGLPR
jgi:hypothetical protein